MVMTQVGYVTSFKKNTFLLKELYTLYAWYYFCFHTWFSSLFYL